MTDSITLHDNPDFAARVRAMAEESGVSHDQVLRRAITLLYVAMEAKKSGESVALINDKDGTEQIVNWEF